MPFKTMGLADPLVKGILATGYTAPTEIQSQAIPGHFGRKRHHRLRPDRHG